MPDVFVSDPESKAKDSSLQMSSNVPKSEVKKQEFVEHTHNKFSSFSLYPDNADFETREENEKIVLLLRQHIIVNLKWVLLTILMLSVPNLLHTLGILKLLPAGSHIGTVIILAWYLVTFAYALESFLSWYFNVYIVTTQRIIDVDFYNMIYKQVSDAHLSKIEDVTYNMGGVVRTIFNYGNVFIQTAAEISEFEFMAVPSPDRVVKIIQEYSLKKNDSE